MEIGEFIIGLAPGRPTVYVSQKILERRRTILKITRALISEYGIEGLSVREISSRAGVAQRTLYNAFGSKEGIIATAIHEAFLNSRDYKRYRTCANTLDGAIDRLITTNRRNLRARNYTRAVVSVYFSRGTSDDIWKTLREIAFMDLRELFHQLEIDGMFEPWTVPIELAQDITNYGYSVINDWACGRVEDEAYIPRLLKGVLIIISGATKGAVRDQAIKYIEIIHETGQVSIFS